MNGSITLVRAATAKPKKRKDLPARKTIKGGVASKNQ